MQSFHHKSQNLCNPNKVINVQLSPAYISEKGYVLTTVKTKTSKRQIPIPNKVIKELVNHKEMQNVSKRVLNKKRPLPKKWSFAKNPCSEGSTGLAPNDL
jgi:hypothetical protein